MVPGTTVDKYTKEMKSRPQVYHYMNPTKNIPHFTPLLNGRHLVYLAFRLVKLRSPDGSFEYIITNLPCSFDIEYTGPNYTLSPV